MTHLKALTKPTDPRFVSWLELAWLAMSPRCQVLDTRVVVRLMDLQGSQAWWGVTLDGRWLRGNNGALTIFDAVPAAERFLRLLKVQRFTIGEHCERDGFVATKAQEVYTLGGSSSRAQRGADGSTAGKKGLPCLQLSQRRLVMGSEAAPRQPARHQASEPVAA